MKQVQKSKTGLRRPLLRAAFLLVLASVVYAGVSISAESEKKKSFEPAGKFIPSEKLKAGDTVAFPVDI